MKRILIPLYFLLLSISQLATANTGTGPLFNVTATGFSAEVNITLCLNGLGILSCQYYNVSALNLSISTIAHNHVYPAAGIKINTPGYTIEDLGVVCTPISNGYCLFSVSDTAPKAITLKNTQPKAQTINFLSTAPTNAAVGGATYIPTAVSTSGLPVTLSIDASSTSICTLSGSVVSFIADGICVINANQAGNDNYAAAPQMQQMISVDTSFGEGIQVPLTAIATPSTIVYNSTSTLSTTGGSGSGAVSYAVVTGSANCSISGTTLTGIGGGTCTVTATKAADANYLETTSNPITITVNQASQTISFTSTTPTDATVGGATYTPTAISTSGLPVTITVDSSSTSICSINSGVVSFLAVGTC
ncbi:MAG: hypothetical protein WA877_05135, partial [Legionella sp.]